MAAAAKSLTDYSQASFQGNAVLAATSYAGMNFPDIPTSNGLPRPWLVEFYHCRDVKVGGVLLTNSPMWNLVLRYDTDVEVADLRVLRQVGQDAPVSDRRLDLGNEGALLQRLSDGLLQPIEPSIAGGADGDR